jgi:hypothetical protein
VLSQRGLQFVGDTVEQPRPGLAVLFVGSGLLAPACDQRRETVSHRSPPTLEAPGHTGANDPTSHATRSSGLTSRQSWDSSETRNLMQSLMTGIRISDRSGSSRPAESAVVPAG